MSFDIEIPVFEKETETNKPEITPSQLLNRIGVYYREAYVKKPETLIQMCSYFSINCRTPEQKFSGGLEEMRRNAQEYYNSLNEEEKKELYDIYYKEVHYNDGWDNL